MRDTTGSCVESLVQPALCQRDGAVCLCDSAVCLCDSAVCLCDSAVYERWPLSDDSKRMPYGKQADDIKQPCAAIWPPT